MRLILWLIRAFAVGAGGDRQDGPTVTAGVALLYGWALAVLYTICIVVLGRLSNG